MLMVLLVVLYTFTNFEVYFNLSARKLHNQQMKWIVIDSLFAILLFILTYMIYKKIKIANDEISVKFKLLMTIGFTLLALGINFMYSYFPITANQQLLDSSEINVPILVAIQVRVFAPVLEELIFRGIFMNLFFTRNTKLSMFNSIFVSGLLFGFLHTYSFGIELVMYSIIGWLLGGAYYYTKDIRCPIIVHLVLNNI